MNQFPFIVYPFIFILGACIGSFLNVVIYRLPRRRKFFNLNQRSKCPRCRRTLVWYELIPIFSYIFLRGRCRRCHKPIGVQYLLVEFIVAGLFVIMFQKFGLSFNTLIGMIGSAGLLTLAIIDGQRKIVPDEVSLPVIAILAAMQFASQPHAWVSLILGMILGVGWFGLQWLVSKGKWVGSGDIRIGAILGIFLGLAQTALALFGAYILGTIWAVYLLLTKKAKFSSQIPFGVFLGIVGILTFLFGANVVEWYQSLL
jgi:prepilin signal peptidase PulO-like enzyme (type II secretory pathway)